MEDNDTWFDAGSECKSAVSMIRRNEIDNLHLHAQIGLRESRSRRVFLPYSNGRFQTGISLDGRWIKNAGEPAFGNCFQWINGRSVYRMSTALSQSC